MNKANHRRIISYFFHVPNIPGALREEFEAWMTEHGCDSELEADLYETWSALPANPTNEAGEREIHNLVVEIKKPRKRIRRVLLYTAVAAAFAVFFLGGYWFAARNVLPEHEITLLTSKGNTGEFILPDGSTVWLNSGSKLTYYDGFSGGSRDVSLDGEAYFEVQKDSLRPFRVEMDGMLVEVIGTSFDAINNDFSPTRSVILKSGTVKVHCDMFPQEIMLAPGEKIDVNKRTGQISLNRVNPQNYCQWFTPRLIFDNAPLYSIITNLERRYNVEITVESKVNLDRRISITIGTDPLEDIMDVLCHLLPIKYKLDDKHLTIM